ncbi:MAG: class I SAM-dependent methyltransferase [Myxococcota bacterium]|jgi:2-polyprenyl-3-methyl-5-hydroxy-6-metoxy-1,4-benzoquinol methylase|nr:class I SAM-dependent methyltransferase [Myxococcota bacterium]MDP7432102.1 class I SAM-dependent methyltransferase [Myxococcota bacterium]HJO22064.1 class I SAM-dependent methyltransferase [Myxococcota bacterium]
MPEGAQLRVRRETAERVKDAQERNRVWWESLPMTYADFNETDRIPATAAGFREVDRLFLEGNPWLRDAFDFNAFAGKKVLEIGCGSGSASCLLARGGAEVTAIDLISQALALTRKNIETQELAVDVRQMDAEELEFPDESFDYVFSWGVIHHSAETERIIAQIAWVLKPGGAGMCMVYNRDSIRYFLHGLYFLVAKGKIFSGHTLKSVQGLYTDGFYQRHWTGREFSAAFRTAGLEPRRITKTHMAVRIIPHIPRFLDGFLKRHFGWLLVLEFGKRA